MAEVVSLSLYDVESNLLALTDCDETCPAELRAQYEAEVSDALRTAVTKRDSFAQFLKTCEHQAANCAEEIKRLQARKARFEAAHERASEFAARVIVGMGTDAKGKYRKLEGNTATLSVRKNPDRVEITDESQVPLQFKTVTAKMPGPVWDYICANLDGAYEAVRDQVKTDCTIDKRAVKAAIDANEDVPGADIAFGDHSLKVS